MKKLYKVLLPIILVLALVIGVFVYSASNRPSTQDGITLERVQSILGSEFTTPKNIIVIIGDGMGSNDITLAQQYAEGGYDFGLVLNQIKNHGLSTTYSADADVTDSAASGTALSTGVKTNNGYIGKDSDGNDLKTMAELAREYGKKIGIITDEEVTGATPNAFVNHNISRDNRAELVSAMIKFMPDVLMSKKYSTAAIADSECRELLDNTYLLAKDFSSFTEVLKSDADGKKPFWGFLNGYSTEPSDNLAQCAEIALERLQNENGFFLLIESAGTDKYGHNGHMRGKLSSVVTLDRTVAAVLKFMEKNPDTLLVITSDHETGGVQLPVTGNEKLNDLLTVTEHTATPVRVFGVGKGTEYFSGKTVDNTDIAKFLIAAIKGE